MGGKETYADLFTVHVYEKDSENGRGKGGARKTGRWNKWHQARTKGYLARDTTGGGMWAKKYARDTVRTAVGSPGGDRPLAHRKLWRGSVKMQAEADKRAGDPQTRIGKEAVCERRD